MYYDESNKIYRSGMHVVCFGRMLDDKTIDEFKVLNQVTIEGLQERYSVLLYNRLQCTPVIRTSQNDE